MDFINFDLRKQRGLKQKLFLIEAVETVEKLTKIYKVMGSTGNIYTVTIKEKPECTCPDYTTRYKRCKHIYFILTRIMKVDDPDSEIYSKKELKEMFLNIPEVANGLFVEKHLKDKYQHLIDELKNGKTEHDPKGTDDVCPICMDDLLNGEEFIHCKFSCGRCVHATCFTMWSKVKSDKCIYCTQPFYGKNIVDGEYTNLLT